MSCFVPVDVEIPLCYRIVVRNNNEHTRKEAPMRLTKSAFEEILKMIAMGGTYDFTTATDDTPMILVKTPKGYTRQFLYEEDED